MGGLILVRDVTQLRDRERELITKDVTIREIHHRVKNNLQTVSSLLKIQARKSDSEEVKNSLQHTRCTSRGHISSFNVAGGIQASLGQKRIWPRYIRDGLYGFDLIVDFNLTKGLRG